MVLGEKHGTNYLPYTLLFLLSVEECEDSRRKFKSGIFKCLNDNVGGT